VGGSDASGLLTARPSYPLRARLTGLGARRSLSTGPSAAVHPSRPRYGLFRTTRPPREGGGALDAFAPEGEPGAFRTRCCLCEVFLPVGVGGADQLLGICARSLAGLDLHTTPARPRRPCGSAFERSTQGCFHRVAGGGVEGRGLSGGRNRSGCCRRPGHARCVDFRARAAKGRGHHSGGPQPAPDRPGHRFRPAAGGPSLRFGAGARAKPRQRP
jgi:hypothetical protein